MSYSLLTLLVPLYFIHSAFGCGVLAWWFLIQKERTSKDFGAGMLGYAIALVFWSILVVLKPTDLRLLVMAGVVPFLFAHIAYAKAAYNHFSSKKRNLLVITVIIAISITFVTRTFLFPSETHFSQSGLLIFGLNPVSIVFYITAISMSFLPAIQRVVIHMRKQIRPFMQVGLIILYLNTIILVVAQDDTLLLLNGIIMTIVLLGLWIALVGVSANISTPKRS